MPGPARRLRGILGDRGRHPPDADVVIGTGDEVLAVASTAAGGGDPLFVGRERSRDDKLLLRDDFLHQLARFVIPHFRLAVETGGEQAFAVLREDHRGDVAFVRVDVAYFFTAGEV